MGCKCKDVNMWNQTAVCQAFLLDFKWIQWILSGFIMLCKREGNIFNSCPWPHPLSAVKLIELRALPPSLGLGQTVMCCSMLIPIYSFFHGPNFLGKHCLYAEKPPRTRDPHGILMPFCVTARGQIISYCLLSRLVSVSICGFAAIKTA